MKKYIIGIDTGGTYTDGVIIESATGEVLSATKTPTTHHQLSESTGTALHALLESSNIDPEEIETVAVSSTLATNSVVEKKGARVALFVIGYVKHFKLPVKAVLFVKGGHSITGEEEEPLDIEYLVSVIENLKHEVDAYGVCSAMSMKNPAHELVTEKAISMIDPKPVFCSHRISDLAGMQERAGTAGLHAKLMPIMQEYIHGVSLALKAHNIDSETAVIGGNAQPISAQKAVIHAGQTVASGPACTAYFGASHSPSEALIIDVGGTTTDIAMIKNGKPILAENGCNIGDWKTHVEAIDMFTWGIGGDSHVAVENDKISIGPRRVTPIATSPLQKDLAKWLGPDGSAKCIDLVHKNEKSIVDDKNPILQTLIEEGASTLSQIKEKTKLSGIPLEKQLEQLGHKQLLYETGFTPTDALHVTGKLELGDTGKSVESATILGKVLGMSASEFAGRVIDITAQTIENIIIDYITQHYWKKSLTSFISSRNDHPVLGVDFSLKIPIVGVGAASYYFLPLVAKRLQTSVHFPPNYQVGNAIGAALICKKECTVSTTL